MAANRGVREFSVNETSKRKIKMPIMKGKRERESWWKRDSRVIMKEEERRAEGGVKIERKDKRR